MQFRIPLLTFSYKLCSTDPVAKQSSKCMICPHSVSMWYILTHVMEICHKIEPPLCIFNKRVHHLESNLRSLILGPQSHRFLVHAKHTQWCSYDFPSNAKLPIFIINDEVSSFKTETSWPSMATIHNQRMEKYNFKSPDLKTFNFCKYWSCWLVWL